MLHTYNAMNYTKKLGFNLYQSRHCAYITYSVKTWFLKILTVSQMIKKKKAHKDNTFYFGGSYTDYLYNFRHVNELKSVS